MRLSESHPLPVPLADAWAALNDLDVLRQAMPGCESLLEIADDEFVGEMAVTLGPATSRFTIYVQRRDVEAPRRCTLRFETRTAGGGGSGGAAFALTPTGDGASSLQVDVAITIDGLVAQIGAPLIDVAARQMAALFFERLTDCAVARRAAAPMS
jgi:carbon monoxide dehydrogenase subunit G